MQNPDQRSQEVRRTVDETQAALLELNAAIVGITDLDQLLERIVQIMPVISGCDRLGVTLYNPETDELIPAAVYGLEADQAAEWKKTVGKRDRTSPYDVPIFVEHRLLEIDFNKLVEEVKSQGVDLPNPYDIKNMLLLPLANQGEVLGMITLDHAAKYHSFSMRELQVLEAMAQMAGFAIANVRLVQKANENTVLREVNRLKDEFMSLVAHELRNPLSAIRGYTQLVKRQLGKTGSPEGHVRNLDRIIEQADRMDRLVGDLLDLTRIESAQLELRLTACDLAEVIQGVLDTFQPNTTDHTFNFELASGPDSGQYTGQYDKDRLGQVISNLVSNAIKYSPKGGPITLRLTHQARGEKAFPGQPAGIDTGAGDVLHLSIADQGIGIPTDQQGQLFQRFFRSSISRSSNVPGLGLGLHISYQIILMHGGTMWVESPGEGQGSIFNFILPC